MNRRLSSRSKTPSRAAPQAQRSQPEASSPTRQPDAAAPVANPAAFTDPGQLSPGEVLNLQRTVGNRAVQRLLASHGVQAKLTVGPAGDQYEEEADQVAAQVMRASDPNPPAAELPLETIQAMPEASPLFGPEGGEAGGELEHALSTGGGGQPLPNDTRAFMEGRIGADFSGVRVHTGPQAGALNRQLGAQAFTHGKDIYMGEGKYNVGTAGGKQLLAHELTHVVQQNGGGAARRSTAPKGVIQAKLAGSLETLRAVSTHGRGWNKILQQLGIYESLETNYAKALSAYLRVKDQWNFLNRGRGALGGDLQKQYKFLTGQVTQTKQGLNVQKKKLLVQLGKLDKTITNWLGRKKHQRDLEQQKQNPTDITVTRRQALVMLLPRVKSERFAIYSGEYGQSEITQGKGVESIEFNKVGGALNKLDLLTMEGGGQGYFKEEKSIDYEYEKRHPGVQTGTPEEAPQFGARSVAMARLDKLLGGNILVKTEFATLVRPDEKGVKQSRMGILMEKAKGSGVSKSIETGLVSNMEDVALQRGLSKLQLLDALAGQVDRHLGNYYIERDEETGRVIAVHGIDNDLAFGTGITDPTNKKQWKGQYAGLPPVIDQELGDRLIRIQPEEVRVALEGLLSQEEIATTLQRLGKLKTELTKMKGLGLFKAADEWGHETAQQSKEAYGYYSLLQGSIVEGMYSECLTLLLEKGVTRQRIGNQHKEGARLLYAKLVDKTIENKAAAMEIAGRAGEAMARDEGLTFTAAIELMMA